MRFVLMSFLTLKKGRAGGGQALSREKRVHKNTIAEKREQRLIYLLGLFGDLEFAGQRLLLQPIMHCYKVID